MAESGLSRATVVNLVEAGIDGENVGFAAVTMQSEHFVCVRESKQSAKSTLKIVDLRRGVEISEKPITADSVIMNPLKPHLALRAVNAVQVFDLDTKAKIASIQVDFRVLFWTWIDGSVLAIVSDTGVHRWDCSDPDSQPQPWFDKSPALRDTQIISVASDHSRHWCVVAGISLKDGRVVGTLQLFNDAKRLSQMIEGHCSCFFKLVSEDDDEKMHSVLAFAVRTASNELKIHIVEIDHVEPNAPFQKRVIELDVDGLSDNDFPVSLLYDVHARLLFMYTKFGMCYVVEPHSSSCVYRETCSESPVFLVVPALNGSSHFLLNRRGDVVKRTLDVSQFFGAVLEAGLVSFATAGRIVARLPVKQQEDLYRQRFDHLRGTERHQEALHLLVKSAKPFLRSFEYLATIKEFPQLNGTSALLEYFAIVLEDGALNEAESLELAQLALKKKKLDILRRWMQDDQIFCTVQLGNLILEADVSLALDIYRKASAPVKVLLCHALLGNFVEFADTIQATSAEPDIGEILVLLEKRGREGIPAFAEAVFTHCDKLVTAQFVEQLLLLDSGGQLGVESVLARHCAVLGRINSKDVNTRITERLIKTSPEEVVRFFNAAGSDFSVDSERILPQLESADLNAAAFQLASRLEHVEELAAKICNASFDFEYVRMSSASLKQLIGRLLEKDVQKYDRLCVHLGRLVDEGDFVEVKDMLQCHVSGEMLVDFFKSWSTRIQSESLMCELLDALIKAGDGEQMAELCRSGSFEDPSAIFQMIADFDYKSEALKIVAARHGLEERAYRVFEDNNDADESAKFSEAIGGDRIFELTPRLLKAGIREESVEPFFKLPDNLATILTVASALEEIDRLPVLRRVLRDPGKWTEQTAIMTVKAKVLCLSDDEEFLSFVETVGNSVDMPVVLAFCEEKNPGLALRLYERSKRSDDLVRLASKMGSWPLLVRYVIRSKDQGLWRKAFALPAVDEIYEQVIASVGEFDDPTSASCVIKLLVSEGKTDFLLRIVQSLLRSNKKFANSRSLQTLHLLTLIQVNDEEQFLRCSREFSNYNEEEVVHSCLLAKKFDLAISVLKRLKLWDYAFKIALYGKNDLDEAEHLAEECSHSETWNALAEVCLATGKSDKAVDYAIRAGDFKRQRDLVVLLHLDQKYAEMLAFLNSARSGSHLEPASERDIFQCLAKLDRAAELKDFISSSSNAAAGELGNILARSGSTELAALCFKRAGSHDKATTCYLQLGDLQSAAETGSKSGSVETWTHIVKRALRDGVFDVADKFATRCLAVPGKAELVLAMYEEAGAFAQLVDVIEAYATANAPSKDFLLSLGAIYCRHARDRLESFVQKHYSLLPVTFVSMLAEHRCWKEAFRLLVLMSEFERALQVVLLHPSVEFDHKRISTLLAKVKSPQTVEKLMAYYHECDPRRLLELQAEFQERVDLSTLVKFHRERNILWMLEGLLKRTLTQHPGNATVSSVLNELLIANNDYYELIESIKKCPTIDGALSKTLRNSKHRHFRVLAAKFLANAGALAEALEILVAEDALFETLMVLGQSGNVEYAEAIFSRHARSRNAVLYLVVGYVLFDYIRPDVILEWAHRAKFEDLSLPLLCQVMRNRMK